MIIMIHETHKMHNNQWCDLLDSHICLRSFFTIWFKSFTESKLMWITPSVLTWIFEWSWNDLRFKKKSSLYSLYRDHHLECSPRRNSTICGNGSVINSKSFRWSLNKRNIFQGHHVLGEITHPVTAGCRSGNLCAHINAARPCWD